MNLLRFVFLVVCSAFAARAASPEKPNIVLIYADDIGWGDLGCYGATAVKTPHLDRLAREGLRFTSAYSAAATCTPSRYALMTGEYPFRQPGTSILPGDAPLIIQRGRATLPGTLRAAGYTTGIVGKWHLGIGAAQPPLDWNAEVAPGPGEVGFDSHFIMAATGDRVPTVYVENRRVANLDPADPLRVSYEKPFPNEPDGVSGRAQLKMDWSHGHNMAVHEGIGRIGWQQGGQSARWRDEDMADVFTQRAVDFIARTKDRSFFLFFAPHDIHVPRVPHHRFKGATEMGPRGDAIAELDASVGRVLTELDRLGLTKNTLVMFSSDNGPVLDDGYRDEARERVGQHRPAGPFRGGKGSLFEGGARVPFLARWPARIPAARESAALLGQVDLLATLAALVGQEFSRERAGDTQNVLPALLGDSPRGRDHLLLHANAIAVRQGDWKFIPPAPGAAVAQNTRTETGRSSMPQLYHLVDDPGETRNLAAEPAHAPRVAELAALATP